MFIVKEKIPSILINGLYEIFFFYKHRNIFRFFSNYAFLFGFFIINVYHRKLFCNFYNTDAINCEHEDVYE